MVDHCGYCGQELPKYCESCTQVDCRQTFLHNTSICVGEIPQALQYSYKRTCFYTYILTIVTKVELWKTFITMYTIAKCMGFFNSNKHGGKNVVA